MNKTIHDRFPNLWQIIIAFAICATTYFTVSRVCDSFERRNCCAACQCQK